MTLLWVLCGGELASGRHTLTHEQGQVTHFPMTPSGVCAKVDVEVQRSRKNDIV